MPNIRFEWDEAKNQKNIAKHGIAFTTVALAMAGDRLLSFRSERMGEERYVSITEINGKLFAIIHLRRAEAIRIISARRARKSEAKQYRQLYPG